MSVPRVTVLILSLGLAACGGRGEDVTLTNITVTDTLVSVSGGPLSSLAQVQK